MSRQIHPLIEKEDVLKRIAEIGKQISQDYAGENLIVLILANGGIFFGVDLLRALEGVSVIVECIRVSSYQKNTYSSGNPEVFGTLEADDFNGNHVLIVDDIIDTGNTIKRIQEQIENFGANSVKICTLLDKPSKRVVNIVPDYSGFTVEDKFIVGYGLDYAGKFRDLPFIGYIE